MSKQEDQNNLKKLHFKVKGMDCTSCAMMIEAELEDIGVENAKCSYAEEKLEVVFDEQKINEEKIKETVKQTGYELQSLD